MKDSGLQQKDLIYCALEAFEADEDKDLTDFADTINRIYEFEHGFFPSAVL